MVVCNGRYEVRSIMVHDVNMGLSVDMVLRHGESGDEHTLSLLSKLSIGFRSDLGD